MPILTVALQAAFYVVFLVALWRFVRRPGRIELAVVAVFGSTAAVLASSLVGSLAPTLAPLVQPVAVGLLLAQPVFANWLVHLVRPQSRPVMALAVAGFGLSALAYFGRPLVADLVPQSAVALVIGGYFAVAEGWAAVRFLHLAGQRHGLARARLRLASMATALFASAVVALAVGSVGSVPGQPNPAQPVGHAIALSAAIIYLVAFLPPFWLHAVAQRAVAYDLGTQLVAAPSGTQPQVLWGSLAQSAARLLGARRVELIDSADSVLAAAGEPQRDAGDSALRTVTRLDVPLDEVSDRAPHLIAEVEGRLLFVEDDIAVLRLLGAMTRRAVEREEAMVRLAEAGRELEAAVAIRASEARFRALLEAVPSAVIAVDQEGTIVWSTGPTADLLGVSVPQLTGRRLADLLIDAELDTSPAWDGRVRRAEVTARRADGSTLPVDAAATAFDLDDRRYQLYVLSDASWRQTANQLRDRFLGVLSHELRTPITSVYGGTQLLLSRGDRLGEETRREVLNNVAAEAERLVRITENLVVLARVERGAGFLGFRPISLRPLLIDLVTREARLWPELSIELDVDPGLPLVAGDEDYLAQVVRNLISNAGKYAGPGARVRVVAGREDGGVAVRVIDNGPGLGESSPEQLFELYYRADDAMPAPGAGIGLFICRSLVEAMGGRIWARTAADGGAEFGFSLPHYVDPAEAPVAARAEVA
jgi:PAS domain S-box-containing protein